MRENLCKLTYVVAKFRQRIFNHFMNIPCSRNILAKSKSSSKLRGFKKAGRECIKSSHACLLGCNLMSNRIEFSIAGGCEYSLQSHPGISLTIYEADTTPLMYTHYGL